MIPEHFKTAGHINHDPLDKVICVLITTYYSKGNNLSIKVQMGSNYLDRRIKLQFEKNCRNDFFSWSVGKRLLIP